VKANRAKTLFGHTGDDFPTDSSDLSGRPRGEPWGDESRETLVQRYPALAARFH